MTCKPLLYYNSPICKSIQQQSYSIKNNTVVAPLQHGDPFGCRSILPVRPIQLWRAATFGRAFHETNVPKTAPICKTAKVHILLVALRGYRTERVLYVLNLVSRKWSRPGFNRGL